MLEILVFRVLREMAVPRVNLVTPDLPDLLDLRERREREDPVVSLVLVDPLVSVEPEVALAAVVCPVVMEELAQLVCLVPVVPLVQLVLVESPEMLAAMVSLVLLVLGVFLEALETLDPQEKRDLLDLLDKTAAPDLPAQLDLEASPETLASPDPKELLVRPVSLETREPLAPAV